MEEMCLDVMQTPAGPLYILCDGDGLRALSFNKPEKPLSSDKAAGADWCKETRRQLKEYFAGERRQFLLPLCVKLTPFQKEVYTALNGVPYGKTITYGELARSMGRPRAARAVGQALRCNPVLLVIPCHRVLGADGGLTGYAGPANTSIKSWLLDLERRAATQPSTQSENPY